MVISALYIEGIYLNYWGLVDSRYDWESVKK